MSDQKPYNTLLLAKNSLTGWGVKEKKSRGSFTSIGGIINSNFRLF